MRYLSLFSGIEACTVAWQSLGWEAVAFAEFDDFPKAVLAHHYPDVPDLGDVTQITEEQIKALGPIDMVVGGSPCQDLSVAGKRAGLRNDDGSTTRSGLFDEQMRIFEIAREYNGCRYLLWENVPGAFSSNSGNDFKYVLESMVGGSVPLPPNKWKNSGVAISGDGRRLVEWRVLDAQYFGVPQRRRRIFALLDTGTWWSRQPFLFEQEGLSGHIAKGGDEGEGVAEGAEGSVGESCAIIYENHAQDSRVTESVGVCPTLHSQMGTGGGNVPFVMEKSFTTCDNMRVAHEEQARTVVRRLTPVECERLQGFPDNYTNIPWAGRDGSPDSRRYKALGNSMAVPVMRWIGERIQGAKSVVYDQYAISIAALPPLTAEEQEAGQGSLF